LNVKSLSLTFGDGQPRYGLEMTIPDQRISSIRLAGPIGLDGVYRKGTATPRGVMAMKGTWSDRNTFIIDVRLIGGDDVVAGRVVNVLSH
jgi:hypothetical protein